MHVYVCAHVCVCASVYECIYFYSYVLYAHVKMLLHFVFWCLQYVLIICNFLRV
jgi:hypothetical protein